MSTGAVGELHASAREYADRTGMRTGIHVSFHRQDCRVSIRVNGAEVAACIAVNIEEAVRAVGIQFARWQGPSLTRMRAAVASMTAAQEKIA